jgi:hypothetical protein
MECNVLSHGVGRRGAAARSRRTYRSERHNTENGSDKCQDEVGVERHRITEQTHHFVGLDGFRRLDKPDLERAADLRIRLCGRCGGS